MRQDERLDLLNRLRKILLSTPVIVTVALLLLYLLLGYVALPAALKWQAEKQVRDKLGHGLSLGQVRFDPLAFKFEVNDLVLTGPQGGPMLRFKRLFIDFEPARSAIDRVWTVAVATLESPQLHFEIDKQGRHNFQALVERLGSEPSEPSDDAELPRVSLRRLALSDARIDVLDQWLAEPAITSIAPLAIEVDALSTLAVAPPASFHVTAATQAGETFDTRGELALDPFAAKGRLALKALQVATLVRSLSRQVAVAGSTGQIDLAAEFALGVGADRQLEGSAQGIDVAVTGLSLSAAEDSAPLLALERGALRQGRVDLGRRELAFDSVALANGRIAASMDANGRLDWALLARGGTPPPVEPAAAPPVTPPVTPVADLPWRVSIAQVEVAGIAAQYADAAQQRNAVFDALGFEGAVEAEFAPTTLKLRMAKAGMSLSGLRLEQPRQLLALPALRLDAKELSLATTAAGLDLGIDASQLLLEQGAEARQDADSMRLGKASLELGRVLLSHDGANGQGTIASPRLALTAAALERAGQASAALPTLSAEGEQLTWQVEPERFEAGLAQPRIKLSGVRAKQASQQLALDTASITAAALSLARAASGPLDVVLQKPALSLAGVSALRDAERAALTGLSVDAASLALQSRPAGLELGLTDAQVKADGLQATGAALELAMRSASMASGKFSMVQEDTGLRLGLEAPRLAAEEAMLVRNGESGALQGLAIDAASASLALTADGQLALDVTTVAVDATGAALARGDDGIDLGQADLRLQALSLTQPDARWRLDGRAAAAALSGLAIRRGADRLSLSTAELETASATVDTGASALDAAIGDAALRLADLKITLLSSTDELLQLDKLNLAASELRIAGPEGAVDVAGDGLRATALNAVLRDPNEGQELVRLGDASLEGGVLRLTQQSFSADALTLARSDARLWLDEQGQLNLATLFAAVPMPATEAVAARLAPTTKASWRIAVKEAQIDDVALGFEDRRETPPLALRLQAMRSRIAGLDTASDAPMQLEFQASLASGGDIRVEGSVNAQSGASDLKLDLAGIALAPLQGMLSKVADLKLASGSVSSAGRLRYGDRADDARVRYEGRLAVDKVSLDEAASGQPFLSWDSVVSEDVSLSVQPNRVDIGDIRVDQPAGRLIIAADQSVNLSDVLKKTEGGQADAAAKASADPTAEAAAPAWPVHIERLRVANGTLEFADLSLRPQFGARMHELEGVISGLGTDAQRSAKLQLDARVDRFGSARIRGQISVLAPEQLTDIDMRFRNLELNSLSPYVAKFAGYRIESGRLALDLQYKVKASKLLGQNKIVLEKLVLGEKVESPDALDLPLELAVAVMKDSKGVIDIGLPVSGDLDDPQFNYGEVIGKAIGNLLGGIVTAPFKALGSMLGTGDEPLDQIAFEPGSDSLAPPERQKLDAVARGLNERSTLVLVVPPTFSAAQDTPVLKSLAVRDDIVQRMGITLAAGEQPGPIDTSDARTQRAIEEAFSARYAPEVLAALKRRAVDASVAPGAPSASASAPAAGASAAEPVVATAAPPPAPAAPAQPPPDFYQGLVDRMVNEQPVSDALLVQLANRRGEAVQRELSDVGGVAASRITLAKALPATEATDQAVTLRLELKAKP